MAPLMTPRLFCIAVEEVRDALADGKDDFSFFHSRTGGDLKSSVSSQMKGAIDLDEAIKSDSNPNPEPKSVSEAIRSTDNLLYIYTSGTTGLPKAVIIKHIRYCHVRFYCARNILLNALRIP
jgi:acyl-coenzyme A synthetase/AMP-(fatty) acid ligase